MICPECGFKNRKYAGFCEDCGYDLRYLPQNQYTSATRSFTLNLIIILIILTIVLVLLIVVSKLLLSNLPFISGS